MEETDDDITELPTDDKYKTLCQKSNGCHDGSIWCCCFAGDRLITGSVDETVKIWSINDTYDLKEETALCGHDLGVVGIDVYDNLLATSSLDAYLRIWNLNTQQLVHQIPDTDHKPASTWMCAFSPDGKLVATGGHGGCVDLYSVENKCKIASLQSKHKFVLNIAPSPCGRFLACSTTTGSVLLFDMSTLQILKTFEDHALPVRTLGFSPDSRLFATGSDDGLIKLYQNYYTGNSEESTVDISTFTGHNGWVLTLHFSKDSQYLAAGSTENCLRVWNLKDNSQVDDELDDLSAEDKRIHKNVHTSHIWDVKFDNNDNLLASVGADETIALFK
ncbi:hypothetical protein GJ496_005876 [Pomphorhynchus laevis]|nr:hypothetical protein GJ496_005876 [Pomphorhynchus laevis]